MAHTRTTTAQTVTIKRHRLNRICDCGFAGLVLLEVFLGPLGSFGWSIYTEKMQQLQSLERRLHQDPTSSQTISQILSLVNETALEHRIYFIDLLGFILTNNLAAGQVGTAIVIGCLESIIILFQDPRITRHLIVLATHITRYVEPLSSSDYAPLLTHYKSLVHSLVDSPDRGIVLLVVGYMCQELLVLRPGVESSTLINRLTMLISSPKLFPGTTASLLTCCLTATMALIRQSPEFAWPIIQAWLKCPHNLPDNFTRLDIKILQRCLKIVLLACFPLPCAIDFADQIKETATLYGARPHEFQAAMHKFSKRIYG